VINRRRLQAGVLKNVSLNHQTRARAVRLAKSDPLMFGSSLADVFSAPAYDCRVFGQEQKPEFAVTRLRSGPREMEKAVQWNHALLPCPENLKEVCVAGLERTSVEALIEAVT
jgi:hypothetical protein